MKILVTGGEGFIGSNLVPAILVQGHSVIVISKTRINHLDSHSELRVIESGFHNEDILDNELPGVDAVIHLAYSTVPENSMKDPANDIHSNVIPTLTLLHKMNQHKVRKMIFVSSGGVVYGDKLNSPIREEENLVPVSSYGISKMMIERNIELLSKSLSIDFCVLRVSNAYGSGQHNKKNQGVINIWLKNIMNGTPIKLMGDGKITRDYIHIKDLVKAFVLVLEKNVNGVYNIGTSIGTSLIDLIKEMESITGNKAKIEVLEDRKYDVRYNVLSYEKFRDKTGWQPQICIKQGLEMILNSEK